MSHISVPGSRIGSVKCSFRSYSKKECGLSGPYKDQEALIPLKTCTKDIAGHPNGCYKTTSKGVEVEWKLCFLRVGLFGEEGDSFAITPTKEMNSGLVATEQSVQISKLYLPIFSDSKALVF